MGFTPKNILAKINIAVFETVVESEFYFEFGLIFTTQSHIFFPEMPSDTTDYKIMSDSNRLKTAHHLEY